MPPARLFRATLLLAVCSALAGCFTVRLGEDFYRPRRTILAADRVELPVTFVGDYFFVEARINGAGPFRLILDSGCSNLVLSPGAAKLAGVQANRFLTQQVTVNGGKGFGKYSTAQVDRLEAGGLKLEGVKALVVSKAAWAGELAGIQQFLDVMGFGSFDGVLGMAALYNVLLEIDYPNRHVAVVRLGTRQFPPDRAVPYNLVHGICIATLDLGSKTARALIDTGNNGGFQIPSLDEIPLLYPKQKMDGPVSYGAGGRVARREWGQLEGDIRLGPVTWQNATVLSNNGKVALIGSRALKPWKVVFDQQTRQLYFLDGPAFIGLPKMPAPDSRFKLGYFGELYRDGIRLLEVDSGYAFDQAGLRVGDVVSTVEGLSVMDWVRGRLPPEISGKPRVKLRAEREGKSFDTILVQGPDEP
jgi:hypothetical protein